MNSSSSFDFLNDVEVRRKRRIFVKKEFLHQVVIYNSESLDYDLEGYWYLCEIQNSSEEFFYWSLKPLNLGNHELCLVPLTDKLQQYFPKEAHDIEKFWNVKWLTWPTKEEVFSHARAIELGDELITKANHLMPYRRLHAFYESGGMLSEKCKDFLRNRFDFEFRSMQDVYLREGWTYDRRTVNWAKSQCIKSVDTFRREVYDQDYYLMRYRGHTCVIKNTKAGFSTISRRIGTNVDIASSAATFRGFAKSSKEINRPFLDDFTGSLTVDEFTMHDSAVLDGIQTPMETGIGKTLSGGQQLDYKTLAKVNFVCNPVQEEGKEVQSSELYVLIDRALRKLGRNPYAAGSRLGCLIVDMNLTQARKESSVKLRTEEKEKVYLIIQDILDEVIPEVNRMYKEEKIVDWLEEDDEVYSRDIKELVNEIPYFCAFLKPCMENHVHAIRHIKGFALETALWNHLYELWKKELNVDVLLETAEEEYENVKECNKKSVENLLGVAKNVNTTEVINQYFKLSSGVEKAIVLAVKYGLDKGVIEAKKLNPLEVFNGLISQHREQIVGVTGCSRYDTWARVEQKVTERVKENLKDRYGIIIDPPYISVEDAFYIQSLRVEERVGTIGTKDIMGTVGTVGTGSTHCTWVPDFSDLPKKEPEDSDIYPKKPQNATAETQNVINNEICSPESVVEPEKFTRLDKPHDGLCEFCGKFQFLEFRNAADSLACSSCVKDYRTPSGRGV